MSRRYKYEFSTYRLGAVSNPHVAGEQHRLHRVQKMASDSLPPSVNWYSSRASDINNEGVLAYASRNAIVLLNIRPEGQILNGYLHGHEQRVVSVAFNKNEGHLLATCGDDCRVKLWNVKSKTFIKEHSYHEVRTMMFKFTYVS